MLIVGLTTAGLAYIVKPALDEIFLKKNAAMLKWIPLSVIILYLLKGVASYGQTVLMNYIGLRIIADLRNALYRKIQMQSLSFFSRYPTGVLMSRITNDVGTIQSTVSDAITSLFKDSFTLLGLIFVIFYRDWQLASSPCSSSPLSCIRSPNLGAACVTWHAAPRSRWGH